jgi:hypothetical protein
MNVLRIINSSSGCEILVKIANSVAKKYGCEPNYCRETGKTSTNFDSAQKSQIMQETAGIFGIRQN